MASRVRKVFGTFEKRAPARKWSFYFAGLHYIAYNRHNLQKGLADITNLQPYKTYNRQLKKGF